MRFLIVNTDYEGFLASFYARHPGLGFAPFEQQMAERARTLFGVADFYSHNLRALGHEAVDVHVNNPAAQGAWAREAGMSVEVPPTPTLEEKPSLVRRARGLAARSPLRRIRPLLRSVWSLPEPSTWMLDVLRVQVAEYMPDVILNHAMETVQSGFLGSLKNGGPFVVGQIASPVPSNEDFRAYDLLISSLPNIVQTFRSMGLRSELHRLAFDPRVLERLEPSGRHIPISFCGSLFGEHRRRLELLKRIAKQTDIQIFGQGLGTRAVPRDVRRRHRGAAWGLDMYQVLSDSSMTLNNHTDVAEGFANNLRLYEATGVGTMLLTDAKRNLAEMWEPGREVVAYRDIDECLELIAYYLEHDDERRAIAKAGQERTLRDHTYADRMRELVNLVEQ